ncbi:hypothetical protein ACS0PU_013214 [Formica fusca]
MYALVKFEDDIYYVGKSNDIKISKNVIKCKYSDGRIYPARIITKNNDKTLLKEILQNIHRNIPFPLCKRINLEDENNSRNYQLNYRNDLQAHLTSKSCDVNEKTDSLVDESNNNHKINMQNNPKKLTSNVPEMILTDMAGDIDTLINYKECASDMCNNESVNVPTLCDINEKTDLSVDENNKNRKTDMQNHPKKLTSNISGM